MINIILIETCSRNCHFKDVIIHSIFFLYNKKCSIFFIQVTTTNFLKLRMDFSTFVITGPNTLTASIFYNLAGSVVNTALGVPSSLATNCQTDTFSVTGSGGTTPPLICGTNTGYHSMIIEKFKSRCNAKYQNIM